MHDDDIFDLERRRADGLAADRVLTTTRCTFDAFTGRHVAIVEIAVEVADIEGQIVQAWTDAVA